LANVQSVIDDPIALARTPATALPVLVNGGARGLARQRHTEGRSNGAGLRAWITGGR